MFFLKLDMHFTSPEGRVWPANHADTHAYPPHLANLGFTGVALRKTLLAERSLTPLWRVLRGWGPDSLAPAEGMGRLDLVWLWVRHCYDPSEEEEEDDDDEDEEYAGREEDKEKMLQRAKLQRVLDVPPHEIGTAQMERVGEQRVVVDEGILGEMIRMEGTEMGDVMKKSVTPFRTVNAHKGMGVVRKKLIRVDQLVMRESVKRELNLGEVWVKMMVWGWHDGIGRKLPILTEEEMLRLDKGLKLLPRKTGGGEVQRG